VSFMHYDLGFLDEEAIRVECAENPFVLGLCAEIPGAATDASQQLQEHSVASGTIHGAAHQAFAEPADMIRPPSPIPARRMALGGREDDRGSAQVSCTSDLD
jgi:hypothetical protein